MEAGYAIAARPGDSRFHYELSLLGDLHDQKQVDYGTAGDPFANVRGSEQWGIPAWVGAMVRANDKVKRLQNFAQRGTLANETADDSFDDLAVYATIAKVLYREASGFDYAAVIPGYPPIPENPLGKIVEAVARGGT